MQRKLAAADHYRIEAKTESPWEARKARLERANQATLPAAKNDAEPAREINGLQTTKKNSDPPKRAKIGARYLPRRRGPARKQPKQPAPAFTEAAE
jgi:hypothetical protein